MHRSITVLSGIALILKANFINVFIYLFIILSIYIFIWDFWPFQNYFTYVEPINKQR